MERLTKAQGQTYAVSCDQQLVVQQLGKFEDFYFDLLNKQEQHSAQLAQLRANGQTKTVKFRELMGQKLQNTAMLIAMKAHGIE